MFRTVLRQFAREANIGEAAEAGPSNVILKILRQHGPLDKNDIWQHAEAAGVKSKRHMKQTLLWLREARKILIECRRLESDAQARPPPMQRKGKKGHAPPPTDRVFIYKLLERAKPAAEGGDGAVRA